MSTFRTHTLIALCLGALAAGASAQAASTSPDPRFDRRQDRQETRIENGIESGALTAHETKRLGREQARLTRAEARAQSDGTVTHKEAAMLEKRQDHASRDIYRQKHDRQTRP